MARLFPAKYLLVWVGVSALVLALLQALLAHRLDEAEIKDLAYQLGFDVKLAELSLERLHHVEAKKLTGQPLLAAPSPPTGADEVIEAQALRLEKALCKRFKRCPEVLPAVGHPRGAWVKLLSEKEPVWLFVPLHPLPSFPPDPGLLSFAVAAGTLTTTLLFLWWEVQRPLRELELGLSALGNGGRSLSLRRHGTGAVRRVQESFIALLHRLELNDQERSMMLAGVAHDLKTPLSRLRLRLGDGAVSFDRELAEGDLNTLERITEQFLVFAGGGDAEPAVAVNLHEWLAEITAPLAGDQLVLDLECLERRVQPTALTRAIGNCIDNCLSYGALPLRLVLRPDLPAGQGFRIEVWDRGEGIAPDDWERALQPFTRLDSSRSGEGHSGLGLAIALRVALAHGGSLEAIRSEEGFALVLRGRSI